MADKAQHSGDNSLASLINLASKFLRDLTETMAKVMRRLGEIAMLNASVMP